MENFSVLFYNLFMKRILVLLIVVLLSQNVSFAKKAEKTPFIQSEQYINTTNQANLFYAENDIKSAFNLFLSIPEEQRTAQNWLLLGNILQDQGKIKKPNLCITKPSKLMGISLKRITI